MVSLANDRTLSISDLWFSDTMELFYSPLNWDFEHKNEMLSEWQPWYLRENTIAVILTWKPFRFLCKPKLSSKERDRANTLQIAKFMGPTWGPPGSCRPQMDPMLAPWTLLSGQFQVVRSVPCVRSLSLVTYMFYTRMALISWWRHQMETFSALLAFVRGIHRSPVNSPNKGQLRGALMFSLICAWINGWVNNREAGDLRHHRAHNDAIVMFKMIVLEMQEWLWTLTQKMFELHQVIPNDAVSGLHPYVQYPQLGHFLCTSGDW